MSPAIAVRARGRAWAAHAVAACGLALAACERAAPPTVAGSTTAVGSQTLPAGTVLTLNGAPILVDEVDAIGSMVARVEVHSSLPNLRRIALTNVVFPRLAARQVAGAEKRESARRTAETWRAALERGETPAAPTIGPREAELSGGLLELGLETWNWMLDAPIGAWSEPIETTDGWRLARVLERSGGARPAEVRARVDVRSFPWDDSESFARAVEEHLDRSKLVFIDESWRDVVPTLWLRRLRGSP